MNGANAPLSDRAMLSPPATIALSSPGAGFRPTSVRIRMERRMRADEAALKAKKEGVGASAQLATATVSLRRGEALGDIDDK